MAGRIKRMLAHIIAARSQGDRTIALTTKTKLVLKGVDPDNYDEDSADDPAVIAAVKRIATQLGVDLEGVKK
jgi:hypothetical protein